MKLRMKELRSMIKEAASEEDCLHLGRFKYPRTFHLPWSLGQSDDDKTLDEETIDSMFVGKEVVVTEKLDGENTTIYSDGLCHARSIDSSRAGHPSRNYVKSVAGRIASQLPVGWRVMGENLYAQHSIPYDKLPDYFLVFGVADENDVALSWDDVTDVTGMLGLQHVPVIYMGPWDDEKVRGLYPCEAAYGNVPEGYVVRVAGSFPMSAFGSCVAKFVRKGHVQTDQHWMEKPVVPNKIVR